MNGQIIDLGYGYLVKPIVPKSETEKRLRDIARQRKELAMCAAYGIDYDEVLKKRGELMLAGVR